MNTWKQRVLPHSQIIRLSAIGAGLLVCSLISTAWATPTDPKILHLLNRLSFGIRPGDIERASQMGIDAYIDSQLNPNSIPESPSLQAKLSQLNTLELSPVDIFQHYNPRKLVNGEKPQPTEIKKQRQNSKTILNQAIEARLQRSIYSERQLQEVMIDFWFNHFNVDANKGLDRLWVGAYEREAIRPYVFGKFRTLLGATAKHPAMLFYLDNWQNSAENSHKKGRFKGLNENYARELMELHTLGVNGGYNQQDVINLAKIFTGWGFKQPGQKVPDGYSFSFNAKRHDFSNKVLLGKPIAGTGKTEGETALDLLAQHPSTARNISLKLARYFVADNPPASLVDRLSQTFLNSQGDIKAVLKVLFNSQEFWDAKYYGKKFKTPYQYVISSLRSSEVEVSNIKPINTFLQQLGMPLYHCPTPDGYKNTESAWLNQDSMIRRLNFATSLAAGKLPLSSPPTTSNGSRNNLGVTAIDGNKLVTTLGNRFSTKTQNAINSSPRHLKAALIFGSSEFMYR
jgi:uncharacterized protein (DUF1800 family)